MRYYEHQRYKPYYSTNDRDDREFMEREGHPCRYCLYPLIDHYNGRCPKNDDEVSNNGARPAA